MNSSNMILLKNLFLASSSLNKAKHTSDKKVKNKAWGTLAVGILIGLILAVYVGITVFGYGYYGMGDTIPMIIGIVIFLISLTFTFLKAGGYLLAFREYDMLMSMPIKTSGIVWAKFMHMFILSLKWSAWIAIPAIVIYGYFMHPNPVAYIMWIILTPLISLLGTVVGSVFAILISGVGANFKHKRAVQTALTLLLIVSIILADIFLSTKGDIDVENTLVILRAEIESVCKVLLPIKWFGAAINDISFLSAFIIILSAIIITELFIRVLSIKFKRINSKLTASAINGNFKLKSQKTKNIYMTIAYKEFKRMTFSTSYMTNSVLMGGVLSVIVGVAGLFVKPEVLLSSLQSEATTEMPNLLTSYTHLIPVVPFIAFLIGGMVMSTCCSLSLEGKNLWIVQSMPIEVMTLLKGKMLFNIFAVTPFVMFAVLGLSFCLKVGVLNWLLFEILSIILCVAGTVRSMCCGVRFVKYDWVNELEVIKQGAAVPLYMFPHLLIMIFLMTAAMNLSEHINVPTLTVIFIVAVSAWTLLDYRHLCRISKNRKAI